MIILGVVLPGRVYCNCTIKSSKCGKIKFRYLIQLKGVIHDTQKTNIFSRSAGEKIHVLVK